jgi:hypothetical protein
MAAGAWLAPLALYLSGPASSQAPAAADPPNYLSSPYHGVLDGDGRIIPCRCRFDGRDFRLGEAVCMKTYVGTVLARCDLLLNNTSWVPTSTPCELSAFAGPRTWAAANRRTVRVSGPVIPALALVPPSR